MVVRVTALVRGEDGFPSRLLDLRDPPPRIWLKGRIPRLAPAVAIVGARRASEKARTIAERMAFEIARAGIAIVSGGAIGIDIAAHSGALRAGRPTLVVLPTPVDRPHPIVHRPIFEQIVERGGGLISENDGPVTRSAFCVRNRLIAALSDVVVVVEAGERSGTTYTVRAARRLGRIVAAVPWEIGDPAGAGCAQILRSGGRAVLDASDVLGLVGRRPRRSPPRVPARGDPVEGGLSARIRAALEDGPRSVDDLARALAAPVSELLVALTLMEIEGSIEPLAHGRFRAV
jgi:DNA processing protein